jgi:hypothetical protein
MMMKLLFDTPRSAAAAQPPEDSAATPLLTRVTTAATPRDMYSKKIVLSVLPCGDEGLHAQHQTTDCDLKHSSHS